MKPLALLFAALVVVTAVFLFLEPGGEDDGSTPDATPTTEQTPNRTSRTKSGRAEPLQLPPIPPAEAVDAEPTEPVDLERGEPATGLVGEILTPTGSALADAIVTVYRADGRSALDRRDVRVAEPVHTNAGGEYRIVGLKGGDDYLLTVEHGAFARVEVPNLTVESGKLREVPDIRLQGGVVISGRVLGPDRRALEGALVQAGSLTDRRRGIVRQVLTDENGDYHLVGLAPGAYEIAISKADLETARSGALTLLSDRAETRYDAQLSAGLSIAGIVRTPDGRPLDGARLSARRLRGKSPSLGTAISGADGRFSIGALGEGEFNVTAERNGFISQTEPMIAAGKKGLRFVLVPTVGVSGTVRDPEGEPVSQFFVRPWRVSPQGKLFEPLGDPRKVRSKDGSFTIDGFTPGLYKIEAFAPGFAPTFSRRFEVKRLFVNGINVKMKTGASLTGLVVDAGGRVVEGATVRLLTNAYRPGPHSAMLYDDSQRLGRTRTDDTGRFVFEGLRPDSYQVEISAKDKQPLFERDVVVDAERVFEIGPFTVTEGGHLKGTVSDARNVPANGARVTLSTAADGLLHEVRAGDRGEFSFRNVAPGSYRISATVAATTTTADDIFSQAIRSLKAGVDVVVIEGQTMPVTLYVE